MQYGKIGRYCLLMKSSRKSSLIEDSYGDYSFVIAERMSQVEVSSFVNEKSFFDLYTWDSVTLICFVCKVSATILFPFISLTESLVKGLFRCRIMVCRVLVIPQPRTTGQVYSSLEVWVKQICFTLQRILIALENYECWNCFNYVSPCWIIGIILTH